jgi:large subunit ribosomal protein L23
MEVLKRPRITEKATFTAEKGQYIFEVTPSATKASVKAAVKDLYKVTAVSVNMSSTPRKKVMTRGRMGIKGGVRKAYVTLKKGEKIDLA